MREIGGFENYFVDEFGNVFSRQYWGGGSNLKHQRKLRRLKPILGKNGYYFVNLYRDGKNYPHNIHRLVLEQFVGVCPANMEACHGNGDRLDNKLENLRWGTRKDNTADKKNHGTYHYGEKNAQSKANNRKVRMIRRYCSEDKTRGSQAYIARILNLSEDCVSRIVNRKLWAHVL